MAQRTNPESATREWPRDEPDGRSQPAGESPFAWEWQAVSVVWSMPGALFGLLARLYLPDGGPVWWWTAGGAVLGAAFGALLEADHLPL